MDFLIAGLGNPGERYARTRHNIGFRLLDKIAERRGSFDADWRQWNRSGGEGLTRGGILCGKSVLLLKPMTYMNRSGDVVSAIVRYHQLEPAQLIVLHDDVDLGFGRLKMKIGGGHGGHNGLRSIEAMGSSKEFYRLRLGVGRPLRGTESSRGVDPSDRSGAAGEDRGIVDWVLGRFSGDEERELDGFLDRAADALELLIVQGLEEAQRRMH